MSITLPPVPREPPPPPVYGSAPQSRLISPIGRRILASLLDGIIIAVPCFVIAIPLFDPLSRLGAWGPLIGFFLALPYFAYFNSALGGGQTIGKSWMHIQVVDAGGTLISLKKSVVRYLILATPLCLGSVVLPASRTPWLISTLISIAVVGIGGATAYFLLFNRQTRQGVHELAVGSYVAESRSAGPLHLQPIWKPHWIILGSLLLVLLVGQEILNDTMKNSQTFGHMYPDIRLIESIQGVQAAGIQDFTNWSGGGKTRSLVVNVAWTGKSVDIEALADQVAGLVLDNDRTVQNYDILSIQITRGYTLGIAHYQVGYSFVHTPSEWDTRLSQNP